MTNDFEPSESQWARLWTCLVGLKRHKKTQEWKSPPQLGSIRTLDLTRLRQVVISFFSGWIFSYNIVYLPPRIFTDGKWNAITKKYHIMDPCASCSVHLCVAHVVRKASNFHGASKLLLALGNLWRPYCMSHSSDLTALYPENWRVPFEGMTSDHYFLRAAAFVHRHSRLLQSRSTSVHT